MEPEKTTLLAALWNGDEDEVIAGLANGEIELTGNFKGHEAEVAAQAVGA